MVFSTLEYPIAILGALLFGGFFVAFLLRQFKIPNVVGFLLAGFIARNYFFPTIFEIPEIEIWFELGEAMALGLIGFTIGTELNISKFMKKPKIISALLIAEVSATFIGVYALVYLFTKNFILSLILAGISTSTAPAATIEVIRKNRAEGALSDIFYFLLAFDDLIAIVIVEGVLSYLVVLTTNSFTIFAFFESILQEIGIAVVVGLLIGIFLDFLIEVRIKDQLEMMEFTLAVLVFTIGFAMYLHTSVVLTTMVIGIVATNKGGNNYEKSKDLLELIMSPVIAVFFVLAGARITFANFFPFPLVIVFYLVGRLGGKFLGPTLMARKLDVSDSVKQNVGTGLLAQGGIALGLVFTAREILAQSANAKLIAIGDLAIAVIIVSTAISELIGSFTVYFGLKRAGELGKASSILDDKRMTHFHE